MTGIVRTVLGDIDAERLGHTQTHEHLLVDLSRPLPADATEEDQARDEAPITLQNYYATRRDHTSQDLRLDDVETAVRELTRYQRAGGSAIVDATSLGLRRDPEGLRRIAECTGVHIIMGSGYYYRDYHPENVDRLSVDDIARDIISDITTGVGEQRIQAGIIGEIGLSWPHHPIEDRVLHAAAIAQAETGAALLVHPGRDVRSPLAALDAIARYGGDPQRVIMSHVDRTLFRDADILRLARTGCYVEFDLFGQEMSYYSLSGIDMPNDATRIDRIRTLINDGYASRVLISQDICHKTNLQAYGGEGYTHILDHVIPQMISKGFTDNEVQALTVFNPRDALVLTPSH